MAHHALAEAIQREILKNRPAAIISLTCFACGRSYGKGDGGFCSPLCRDAFDAGYVGPYQAHQPVARRAWVVVAQGHDRDRKPGRPVGARVPRDPSVSGSGCLATCRGCCKEFTSKGLRCCGEACERQMRERKELAATMAEVGMEALPKRALICQHCGISFPRWRNGKTVPKTTRFCSRKCADRAARAARQGKPLKALSKASEMPVD